MFKTLITFIFVTTCSLVQADHPARNVILITADGLRWQEVFRGADADMMTTGNAVENKEALLSQYDVETTAARRERLMPFLWGHVAKTGQLLGNRDLGSIGRVTNEMWFSYPGYNELFTGWPDDARISSNKNIPNPNVTVFEWLAKKPGIDGRVVAVGAWDCFPYIFNSGRCGFPVDGGTRAFEPKAGVTPGMAMINKIRLTTPLRWNAAPFDSFVAPMYTEYLAAHKPRVSFLGLGETDEWGHEGNYAKYLEAAHRVDAWLKELWELTQGMSEYKDNTTFILTCDHGRGDDSTDAKSWNSHGRKVPGSDAIFMAVWGPDTPAKGEVKGGEVTQSQVAATVAAAAGFDYATEHPKAGKVVEGLGLEGKF